MICQREIVAIEDSNRYEICTIEAINSNKIPYISYSRNVQFQDLDQNVIVDVVTEKIDSNMKTAATLDLSRYCQDC